MTLGYGNIRLRRTKKGEILMCFGDTSRTKNIADLLEQPITTFGDKKEHLTTGGTIVHGQGFVFESEEIARAATKKIVEEIYRKPYEDL